MHKGLESHHLAQDYVVDINKSMLEANNDIVCLWKTLREQNRRQKNYFVSTDGNYKACLTNNGFGLRTLRGRFIVRIIGYKPALLGTAPNGFEITWIPNCRGKEVQLYKIEFQTDEVGSPIMVDEDILQTNSQKKILSYPDEFSLFLFSVSLCIKEMEK